MNIGSRGFQQGFYTVSQKVVHQTHGDNFVNTEFHDSFTAGKRTKFPTNLTTMLPHYLAKFEFVVISKKKQSENCVTFDKNWNVSCHMAEYCHNICWKCPPFARTHARGRHSSVALSVMVRSMSCQTCSKSLVHNTYLHKIVYYLQRMFNMSLKLKQQVH